MSQEPDTTEISTPTDPSLRNRVRDSLRNAGERIQSTTGTLSGTNIEQQVSEYSELYTQVVIGLHQDMREKDKQIQEQTTRIKVLEQKVESIQLAKNFALISIVIALASIGVAVWAAF